MLSAGLISLFRVFLRQIFFVRIATGAGLTLFVSCDAALVGAFLIFGFSFLAAREFLRGFSALRASKGEAKAAD